MVKFSVKNSITFVIIKILKFVKITTRGRGKLKNIKFFKNLVMQL
jgi:hypothetical protein